MRRPSPSFRRMVFVLALAALALALVDAFVIEPFWIEVTHPVLPAAVTAPLRIALIADLHTRGLGLRERRLLDALDRERPDVILLAGDVTTDGGTTEGYAEVLRRLHAPRGVWMVKGNWEHWRAPRDSFWAAVGVRLLVNRSAEMAPGIWLVGLDDAMSGTPDLDRALRHVPADAARIALFHSPGFFDQIAARCPIALAGHTHGGQVCLPLIGPLWLPRGCGDYLAGEYARDGARLYVSRGIGTSLLAMRFLCRPELAIVTLTPSRPAPRPSP